MSQSIAYNIICKNPVILVNSFVDTTISTQGHKVHDKIAYIYSYTVTQIYLHMYVHMYRFLPAIIIS